MIETIIQWDKDLFRIINQDLISRSMDFIMHYVSERWIWIPLYLALLIYLSYLYKTKVLWIVFSTALLVASTDIISSQAIKKSVQRYRPCQERADLGFKVRQLPGDGCSEYGFVSSHAANSFGLAIFLGLLLYKNNKWWLYGALIWATIIGFSRIYLGQHYPLDVLCGALLGTGLALLWNKILQIILMKKKGRELIL